MNFICFPNFSGKQQHFNFTNGMLPYCFCFSDKIITYRRFPHPLFLRGIQEISLQRASFSHTTEQIRLRIVPPPLSPSSETVNEPRGKNGHVKSWGLGRETRERRDYRLSQRVWIIRCSHNAKIRLAHRSFSLSRNNKIDRKPSSGKNYEIIMLYKITK